MTLWCPLHGNKALGLGHDENAGLDLLRMAADQRNQTEVEWVKEHPHVMTTELYTSQSQPRPEMLSVKCHKQTPTDNVPVPLPSQKMRRSSLQTPMPKTHPCQGGHSHYQEAEEEANRIRYSLHTNGEENDELPCH